MSEVVGIVGVRFAVRILVSCPCLRRLFCAQLVILPRELLLGRLPWRRGEVEVVRRLYRLKGARLRLRVEDEHVRALGGAFAALVCVSAGLAVLVVSDGQRCAAVGVVCELCLAGAVGEVGLVVV